MKKSELENIMNKYNQGKTTLEEEQSLFEYAKDNDLSLTVWAEYLKQRKKKAPDNLKSNIWKAIQSGETRKRKLRIGLLSAAASVLLIIGFSINYLRNERMDYLEKEALLQEVLNMLPDEQIVQSNGRVLYEDNSVIIYLTSK